VTLIAEDVHSFELQRCDGIALPALTAGAHIQVEPSDGLARH
jgi:ferredoxin-NADP reductase